jgi:hypothetical protein
MPLFPAFPTMKDGWSLSAADKAFIDGTTLPGKKALDGHFLS